MFMHCHAAEFETASLRARQRWAEHLDQLLGDGSVEHAVALREARDLLIDSRVPVSNDDFHELMRTMRRCPSEALEAFVSSYGQPA